MLAVLVLWSLNFARNITNAHTLSSTGQTTADIPQSLIDEFKTFKAGKTWNRYFLSTFAAQQFRSAPLFSLFHLLRAHELGNFVLVMFLNQLYT